MHYLSDAFRNAEQLSASKVTSRAKAGWQWHRLGHAFAAAGGSAAYSRALVSPAGAIAFVSDRAPGMEALAELPVLEINYDLLPLSVPFEEKERARELGAVWVAHRKTWACAPEHRSLFGRWLDPSAEIFNLLEHA